MAKLNNVLAITLISVVVVLDYSSAWDNVLFKPYCGRSSFRKVLNVCFNFLEVSTTNAMEKTEYSAANTGTTSIGEQANLRTTSFTVVTNGRLSIECTSSKTKSTLAAGETVELFAIHVSSSTKDLKGVITGSVPKDGGIYTKGVTIFYRSTVPLTCSWKPTLPMDSPPQLIYPSKIYKCTVKPDTWTPTCTWIDQYTDETYEDLIDQLDVRPELSNSGEGLIASATASCTMNDKASVSCTWGQLTYGRRTQADEDIKPERYYRYGPITRASWNCGVNIFFTKYTYYYRPNCYYI